MPICCPNAMIVTGGNTGSKNSCGDVGPADCLNGNLLSRRHTRGQVIDQLKDFVLLSLGAPTIDVELDEQQLDLVVKNTLKILEEYAPREFYNYYTFTTEAGKSIYEMPPDVGYIRNVFYRKSSQYGFSAQDIGGSIPIEYFYPGGSQSGVSGAMIDPTQPIWERAGEWQLYKSYERLYSKMSSTIGGWEFIGGYKHVKLYPIPSIPQQVHVHYMQKCFDWQDVTLAMQEGALAQAKKILGLIRRRYGNLPGPGGGAGSDGDAMYNEGREEYEQWKKDIIDKWSDIPMITFG